MKGVVWGVWLQEAALSLSSWHGFGPGGLPSRLHLNRPMPQLLALAEGLSSPRAHQQRSSPAAQLPWPSPAPPNWQRSPVAVAVAMAMAAAAVCPEATLHPGPGSIAFPALGHRCPVHGLLPAGADVTSLLSSPSSQSVSGS